MSNLEEYYRYLNSDAYRRETALRQAEATVSRSRGYGSGLARDPDQEAVVVLRLSQVYEAYLTKGEIK